jgi:hypothetical protein
MWGYLRSARMASMNESDRILDEPSSFAAEEEKELTGPRHLTGSQAAALRQLSDLVGLRGQSERAGIRLRNKPLVVGPSGSGKTAVIRRLCDTEELPLLVVNAGAWIVYGAHTAAHTLTLVRRFVESHPHGCILIDEIDKACPSGAETFRHNWSLGVFTEVVSLCDADGKLETCGWTPELIKRLTQSYFLVGAGAWQAHAVSARKPAASDGTDASYAQKIIAEAGIPEEILFRFNSRLIEITPPTRKDLALSLRRIHSELALPPLSPSDESRLLEEAVGSHCGMRWVEQYLADLLIRHPQSREKVEKPKAKKASDKIKVGRREFHQQLGKGVELMEAAQKTIRELEIKLLLQREVALHAPPDQRKDLLDPKELATFVDDLHKFAPALFFGTSTSLSQRHLRETELSVHGATLLKTLEIWLQARAFALRSCGVLDLAIHLEVSVKRIIAYWIHLGAVEVIDEAT